MDIITLFKKNINKLYENKLFRFVFFAICFAVIIFNYSNIRRVFNEPTNTNVSANNKNDVSPQKVNIVKKIRTNLYKKEIIENQKKEDEEELKLQKEKEAIKEKEREEKIAKIKLEFTTSPKNGKIVKQSDFVNVKMLSTNGDNFDNIIRDPVEILIIADKKSDNFVSKRLVGKRVGDVVVVTMGEFVEESDFKNNFEKQLRKNGALDKKTVDNLIKSLKKSPMKYRIKIVSIENKDNINNNKIINDLKKNVNKK